jgi:hypothetical protein
MRFRHIFILFAGMILTGSCAEKVQVDTHFTTFKQLYRNFSKVPNAYLPVPFWVWNGEMTTSVIDEQLEDFAEKGFGGVFVHPRYGLITEYASEEWYSLVEHAAKRARRLGLDLWLYDENSFPSGFAGGHVPAAMPGSYNEGHALRMHRQNVLQPDSTKEYLLIFSAEDSLVDITASWQSLAGTKGEFILFEKIGFPVRDWYAGFSYVDLLKPGVTEKFIEVTMTGYEERTGSFFGNVIPGVFTDEPNIAPQGGDDLIRWTPDLFEQFENRWGYRLEPHLHALVEATPMSGQVRHNYYQLLLELFIERWSKPWYEYTEANDLDWTGHYWEHGWPSPHHGPDHMAMYAWHQVPGIDMLFNAWDGRPDQFGNVRAVRELNSVGNQLGKVRKLSETYGASGWELTFEDMKRNGDWEFVLGVNLMNQHLSYQTLVGDRKHDFPQSFSYHAPYWEEYPVLNAYFGRLSLALSTGEQVNRTLILEPTTSVWMKYQPGVDHQYLDAMDEEFSKMLELLESEQIEYDLGSENIIRDHGTIEDDMFVIGQRKYNYIVIPRFMTNLNSETAGLLEQYLAGGGTIIALCEPPAFIDGKATGRCQNWTREYADQWYTLGGCNDPRLINYLHRNEFVIVEQHGGKLLHMRRQLEDGQLLFLVNSSKEESCSVSMLSQGEDIAHLDLFTGKVGNYPGVRSVDILSFDAELAPCGSLLLFIGESEIDEKERRQLKWTGEEREVALSEIETRVPGDNVLNLDYCRVFLDNDTSAVKYFYEVQTDIFQHHGFEVNPWVSASQFRTEIIDRDTFPPGSGFTVQYPFFVDTDFRTRDLRLVVERPHLYEVRLNDVPLEPEPGAWWLDKEFGVYRITEGINPGNNYIEVKADPMSVYCELEPVYLVGDFDVLPLNKGWLLAASDERTLGSWKDAGLPFYGDRVTYSATFELEKTTMAKVSLPDWHGTVAAVSVNGKQAGTIFAQPWELRIDKFVRRGRNEVKVTVYGSLKNLLGPHHNVSNKGIVTPWSFKYAPAEQPSGVDYDLVDYGLFDPFTVTTIDK